METIPHKTTAVIIPPPDISPAGILEEDYIPFLDDITSSAVHLISQIDSYPGVTITLKGISLYPGVANRLQPVWLLEAPGFFLDTLQEAFYRDFTQNKYHFQSQEIHKLHVQDRIIYAVQLGNLLLMSESSIGIEDAIRSYQGSIPSLDLRGSTIEPSSLVLNTPSLDQWIAQLVKVVYHPGIKGSFSGMGPANIKVTRFSEENRNNLQFSGAIPLTDLQKSELVAALSSENAPVTLNRYISSNAASFALFRLPPRMAPPENVADATPLDSLLLNDQVQYAAVSRSLNPEFSLVNYTESGWRSMGEHLFLRKLKDRDAFKQTLDRLVQRGVLTMQNDGTYLAQSRVLAEQIGSELCTYTDFYLNITGEIVVISQRRGLANLIASDRNRRRVIYYEQKYMDIRRNLPEQVSGFVFTNTDFHDAIQPFLVPDNNVNAITSQFNQLTLSLQLNPEEESLALNMRTYSRQASDSPFEEQWVFSTGGSEISGNPVLANLRGSSRDEIIFATRSGRVFALATDGTVMMEANTGNDRPVGSPVIHDWYGTNQNIILLAAGNKIYGWNDTGAPLPQFPFELDEAITTPISISDINQDGLPEAVVATADRRLHALDGRGNNISNFPLSTNAVIRNKPVVDYFQGRLSVVAFSENAVHAWNSNGNQKVNFPIFINASLVGSPLIHSGQVIGGAADGYLYSVGSNQLFSDSLNVYSNLSDSSAIEAVYISNSSLTGSPSVHTLTVQSGEQNYRERMILTMSSNGSLFLINEQGQLRFTKSMGQPAARDFSPFVTDINSDGIPEVIALAGYGRLYAWQVTDGERIHSLPTSGMRYPVVTDLDGDGNMELIAQTNEGLRAWTIYENRE